MLFHVDVAALSVFNDIGLFTFLTKLPFKLAKPFKDSIDETIAQTQVDDLGCYYDSDGHYKIKSNLHLAQINVYNDVTAHIYKVAPDVIVHNGDRILVDVTKGIIVKNITGYCQCKKLIDKQLDAKWKGLRAYPIAPLMDYAHERDQIYEEFGTGRKLKKRDSVCFEHYVDLNGNFVAYTEKAEKCKQQMIKDMMELHHITYEVANERFDNWFQRSAIL